MIVMGPGTLFLYILMSCFAGLGFGLLIALIIVILDRLRDLIQRD